MTNAQYTIVNWLIKITLSQKKAPQLYHGGFYYRLTKPNQSGNIKWKCTRRGCKGSCETLSDTVGTCYNVQIKNDCHVDRQIQ